MMNNLSVNNWTLFDIFVHELAVEIITNGVVDKTRLLAFRINAGTVLEDNIIVPASFNCRVPRASPTGRRVAEQRISAENVLGADSLLLRPPLDVTINRLQSSLLLDPLKLGHQFSLVIIIIIRLATPRVRVVSGVVRVQCRGTR